MKTSSRTMGLSRSKLAEEPAYEAERSRSRSSRSSPKKICSPRRRARAIARGVEDSRGPARAAAGDSARAHLPARARATSARRPGDRQRLQGGGRQSAARLGPARLRDPAVASRLGSGDARHAQGARQPEERRGLRAALSVAETGAGRSLGRARARARVRAPRVSRSDDRAGSPAWHPRNKPPPRRDRRSRSRRRRLSLRRVPARRQGIVCAADVPDRK